eukprot:2738639-Prymnesium_polylepis.1
MSSMKTPVLWRGTGSPSSAITVIGMSTFSTVYAPLGRHSSHVFSWLVPDSCMMSHMSFATTAGASCTSSSRRARATKRAPSIDASVPARLRAVRTREPIPEPFWYAKSGTLITSSVTPPKPPGSTCPWSPAIRKTVSSSPNASIRASTWSPLRATARLYEFPRHALPDGVSAGMNS